jgi:hypothetical protein
MRRRKSRRKISWRKTTRRKKRMKRRRTGIKITYDYVAQTAVQHCTH